MNRLPARTARHCLALLLAGATTLGLSACRGEADSGDPNTTSAPASTTTAPATTTPPPDDDEDDATQADVLTFEELGRIDVDGYVHTLALDDAGRLVMASRQGRRAAWLFDPTPASADLRAPAAVLELDEAAGFASAAVPLADGLFALLRPDGQRVTVARATTTPDGTGAALERVQAVATRGVPADATLAFGQLWLAARQAPDGRGLLGIDPASGELREQLQTGPTPVSLLAVDGPPERLLAVLLTDAGSGELAVLEGPTDDTAPDDDEIPAGRVVRLTFDGVPLQVLAPTGDDARAWVLRHDRADLLPIDLSASPLATGEPLALPFAPRTVARDGTDRHLLIAHGDGRIARVPLGTGQPVERTLGRGTTELAVAPDGEHVLALDPDARRLVVLDRDTLETAAEHPLDGRPGRMAVDPARERVYISLPERQEVVVIGFR